MTAIGLILASLLVLVPATAVALIAAQRNKIKVVIDWQKISPPKYCPLPTKAGFVGAKSFHKFAFDMLNWASGTERRVEFKSRDSAGIAMRILPNNDGLVNIPWPDAVITITARPKRLEVAWKTIQGCRAIWPKDCPSFVGF